MHFLDMQVHFRQNLQRFICIEPSRVCSPPPQKVLFPPLEFITNLQNNYILVGLVAPKNSIAPLTCMGSKAWFRWLLVNPKMKLHLSFPLFAQEGKYPLLYPLP